MKKEIYISKGVGETRIAVKENGKLAELHVDKQSQVKTVGNIYKGVVENVIPGMQAAFVNIGQEVNARIKYKGLVKRKYVPVHFKNKDFSFSNLDKIDNKIKKTPK